MKNNAFQLIVLWLLLGVSKAIAAGITFPGEVTEVSAPLKKCSVKYENIGTAGPYGPHGLFFVDSATRESKFIIGFERFVEVLWSPEGTFLAITNWFGSNVSELFVARVTSLNTLEIRDVLEVAEGDLPGESEIENLNEYFEALSWETSSILKFKIQGRGLRKDGSIENYEHHYLYDASIPAIQILDK